MGLNEQVKQEQFKSNLYWLNAQHRNYRPSPCLPISLKGLPQIFTIKVLRKPLFTESQLCFSFSRSRHQCNTYSNFQKTPSRATSGCEDGS